VIETYRDVATRLELIGITASQLRAERVSVWRLALSALVLFLAGSLVVAVTLIHLPAVAIVVVATGLVRSTATKGTVRILVGLVTLLLTWIIAGMMLADGWAAVAAGVGVAVGGLVALIVWPPLVRQVAVLVGRIRVRDRIALVAPVITARSALVDTVRDSIEGDHDHF
jgi:hypothetical protein